MRDLHKFIQLKKSKGHKIILISDMNEDAYRFSKSKTTYGKLSEQEQLYSLLFELKEDLLPSHSSGLKVIDHIGVHNISPESILRAGKLLLGMFFWRLFTGECLLT